MACLITFKVDVDPNNGQPSRNLTLETQNFFKKTLGLDIKTTEQAVREPKVE